MSNRTWATTGLLLGALVFSGCTLKDTTQDKPPGNNSIENREAAPPAGTPDNPSNQQPTP